MKKLGNYTVRILVVLLGLLPFALSSPSEAQYLKDWKNTVFLEAEGFADCGGWTLDQQYMDQMGSPVLLAHGWGNPVADAKTKVVFPKKGTYRLYVRTRNWVSPWTTKYAPGTFRVLLDGKPVKTVFGTTSDPWFWQQGDNVTIVRDKQEVEIALHDETGFDGRVDAICFTADNDFIPPNDLEKLQPLRRQAQNVPDVVPLASKEPFDLVVVGGGSCLVKNFGQYDETRVTIFTDICATAKGYEMLAE
ncbi:MAG: hypothetical protein Q4G59_09835, partial [Planctomycetia bacterium]|nr:hypothetical protein [Planctomycetia bacterium]